MKQTNQSENNLNQTQSNLGKLPQTDDQSIRITNTSSTLFYKESSNTMDDRKEKRVLIDILDKLEKKVAEVENDLIAVNATITYQEGRGYLFLAQSGGNEVARIDYKLHILVPKMREHMLAVISLSTLLEKQDEKMTDEFYAKLKDVRTRFDNKLGAITPNELSQIETFVKEEMQSSSKGKEEQHEEPKCLVM